MPSRRHPLLYRIAWLKRNRCSLLLAWLCLLILANPLFGGTQAANKAIVICLLAVLMLAASRGDTATITLLLEKGARRGARTKGWQRYPVVFACDATNPPAAKGQPRFAPCSLVFLDPPYGKGLIAPAITALRAAGWIAPDALIVAEMAIKDDLTIDGLVVEDERRYGKAKVVFAR